MPEDKSVSASLIRRSDLPLVGIVAVDALIGGEQCSIIVSCAVVGLSAWLNICPHQGRRLDYAPGKFLLHEGGLVCAAHGAVFSLADGECVGGPCRGEHLQAVQVSVGADGLLHFS